MRIQNCLAALAASVAVASPALAQVVPPPPPPVTDFDTATARGVVLGAHSLKKSRDLDFGVIAVDSLSAGGTVSIAPSLAGNRSVTGGVTGLTSSSSSAVFAGSAAPNEQVLLTLSGPATTSLSDGAGNSIPSSLVLDAGGATRNADP